MAVPKPNAIDEQMEKLSITAAVEKKKKTPDSTNLTHSPCMIDNTDALKALVTLLSPAIGTVGPLAIDLEGVNLCRYGTISLLQVWVESLRKAYVVDVHAMAFKAFDTANSEGKTLRSILEGTANKKYFFDVRNDSDALFAHYNVRLAGIVDVQLLELASRRGSKRTVSGLAKCLQQETSIFPSGERAKWQATKDAVVKLFKPEFGGSFEVFNARPLPQELMDYCVGDVEYLLALARIYEGQLSQAWASKAALETENRLAESRSPSYNPKSNDKVLGPRDWQSTAPKTHNKGRRNHSRLYDDYDEDGY